MSIEELIAKLEAAAEGSSELDWWIYLTATDRGRWEFASPENELILPWPQWIENHPIEMRLPHYYDEERRPYTRSIDAALTLAPDRWSWRVGNLPSGQGFADLGTQQSLQCVVGATPALALCTAALHARAGCPDEGAGR